MASGLGSSALPGREPGDASARRNSPATIVLLFLGVGTVAIIGLCGGALYFFQPHVSEQPVDVRTLTAEMLTIDVPDRPAEAPVVFEPRGTIRWNVAFMMSLRGAYYQTQDDQLDGLLMFLEVSGASLEKPQVREHVDRVLRERSDGRIQLTPGSASEHRLLPVRGIPAEFTYETGVSAATGDTYRLITGIVIGNGGSEVLIALRIKQTPPWDDAIAEQMIGSIR